MLARGARSHEHARDGQGAGAAARGNQAHGRRGESRQTAFAGKWTCRERLAKFFDGGAYFEVGIHGTQMSSTDPNDKPPADGVVCGYGQVDGRLVCAAAYDFTV